ncbi:universal stress protein PHOS34-like [Ananas comosus]|uniref:Universal stress protein PHOS34-like n=1 Tax=Ananas comosus TaxID=4615 RepID=A0A6P5GHG5_ANACO|nr:universal stress protein PHOS34-like [Ananas comosus]
MATAAAEETTKRRTVMVVGIEDSEHSYYALGWTLRRFFGGGAAASGIDLVIVHAKPSPANVVNLAGPGAPDVLPFVESDLRAIAAGVVAKARELCATNSVSALVEVVEGDARYVLCEAVEKHQADILVVGSHGYGAIKRAVLGSVSDYCAHHAHCTVMIVKKPKSKH